MSFECAQRLTEILLALALLQSALEHLVHSPQNRIVFAVRIICCGLILGDLVTPWALLGLFLTAVFLLHRFQGPYNGGSDKMGILILLCLGLSHAAPTPFWQDMAFAYLAVQLTLSYFISGRVKLMNAEWRSGQALSDVFAFSAYPVAENLRGLAHRTGLLHAMSWSVIGFEVLFPLTLLSVPSLYLALIIASLFHMANACLFGLNRFLWIWIAAYPSLIWFQDRIFG